MLHADWRELLIYAFISYNSDYCISLYTNYLKYIIHELQKVQNSAARLKTESRKFDHTGLHWLIVVKRFQFKTLRTIFKCLHNTTLDYFANKINIYSPNRNLKLCFGCAKLLIFLTKILNRISGLNENDNLEMSV